MGNYKITIGERVELDQFMPKNGSFEKLVIRESIMSKIGITQEDIKEYKIEVVKDKLQCINAEVEYTLTELEHMYIYDLLKDLSSNDKLPSSLLNLYRKIV